MCAVRTCATVRERESRWCSSRLYCACTHLFLLAVSLRSFQVLEAALRIDGRPDAASVLALVAWQALKVGGGQVR